MKGISIVICTYNGKSRITSTLDSISKQQVSFPIELIVVDNASTDGTGKFCIEYLNVSFPVFDWKVITEPLSGLLFARIAGLNKARYDWVLFCDDDNVLFPDFLANCVRFLSQNSKLGVLGSQGIPEFLDSKPKWFDRYSSSYAVGPQLGIYNQQKRLSFVYGACSVYLKQPLITLFQSGFKPALADRTGGYLTSGGDVEWCALMQLLGYEVAYSANVKFYHQLPAARLTWEYYLRLKRGISGSAGLLYPYEFFIKNSFRSIFAFQIFYIIGSVKSWLLYLKYRIRWNGNSRSQEQQLAFTILEARMKALFHQRTAAVAHFRQLKNFFGT